MKSSIYSKRRVFVTYKLAVSKANYSKFYVCTLTTHSDCREFTLYIQTDRQMPTVWTSQPAFFLKKGKKKVQGVSQSQTPALPNTKRKRKPINPNKHKSNKRTKSTKISSLFPKRGNRNTKRTEKKKTKTK